MEEGLAATLYAQVLFAFPEAKDTQLDSSSAMAMLEGIAPRDILESMLATQMVAVHNLSIEFAKRARLPVETTDNVQTNINTTVKLMRTFTQQMEALQRYRGKGRQTMTVQHVNVNDGGQAVVGNVGGATDRDEKPKSTP